MNDEKYLRFYKLNENYKLSLNTSNDYFANENHYHIICTPEKQFSSCLCFPNFYSFIPGLF